MPELPEVETIRLGLNQVTPGHQIQGGDVLLERTIAYPDSRLRFLSGLQGSTIQAWHRRGKYLLAALIHPERHRTRIEGWLGVHLRMTGQLLWCHQTDALPKHTRVRLFFARDRELRFVDQRTFGQMWWIPPDQTPAQIIPALQSLGPEPFSPDFSIPYFTEQLRRRQRPIKNALLDQTIVAGLGNIYADEALFLSQVHPQALCNQLEPLQIERLHQAILEVLQASLNAGGTTFSTFLNVEGINGNYGRAAWVYQRTGEPCRICGTPIQRLKLAGRSTHFCAQCQPLTPQSSKVVIASIHTSTGSSPE